MLLMKKSETLTTYYYFKASDNSFLGYFLLMKRKLYLVNCIACTVNGTHILHNLSLFLYI